MSKFVDIFSLTGVIIVIISLFVIFNKSNFYNIEKETQDSYYEYNRLHGFNNFPTQQLTNTEIVNYLKNNNSNGPQGGSNIVAKQNKYDMVFKDIIVNSEFRDTEKYPNPNNYVLNMSTKFDKIYKAELIEVNIPAATDLSVNIPADGNRLYFSYLGNSGYVIIQPGTYLNPESIAMELSRQFAIVLGTTSVNVSYDKDLNRYIIRDTNGITIYSKNGYVIDSNNTVTNSITPSINLNYNDVYVSGPKIIKSTSSGVLYVADAVLGDFGEYNGINVPLNGEPIYSNCIMSDVVLTNCKLFLSLGKLNGDTCNLISNESKNGYNTPSIFCQLPNNTCVSSSSVKTLLNQPNFYSSMQFYNPPISKLTTLNIKWYNEYGELVRILDHCFTIRVYYFQKIFSTTEFSYPVP